MPEFQAAREAEKPRIHDTGTPRANRATEASPTMVVERVRLSDIRLGDDTFQYRFPSRSKDVISSVESQKQRQPIDLIDARPPYRIVDGFRRLAEARELGWDSIEAIVHRGIDDKEAMRIAFTKNVVRKNLSYLERANAILIAKQQGYGRREIAECLGLSERQVNRYLEYRSVPDSIKKICDGSVITVAHAKVLAEFEVRNPEKWRRRIEKENLDAKSLKKVLIQDRGGKPRGRPKSYFRSEKGRVRLYGFTVSLNAPQKEKDQAIEALAKVIDLLREGTQAR